MTLFEANRALLKAFRSGDRAALTEVYWAYVEAVERILRLGFSTAEYRVSGLPEADIADAVQDTFIRAFQPRARDAYDGYRPFRPYLLRIARNLLVDRARKSGRLQFGVNVDVDAVDDTAPAPDDAILSKQLHAATRAFVATLDPPTRAFVVARFEEGCAQEEVAATLGITRRRVRTLEGRLRQQLAAHLAKAGLAAALEVSQKDGPDRPAVVPRT